MKEEDGVDYGTVLKALVEGKIAYRKGWHGKGLFIFMQIPSVIPMSVVPNMQSLPQSVKEELKLRYETKPEDEYNTVRYSSQLAILHPSNLINGWVASASDSLAKDWVIKKI